MRQLKFWTTTLLIFGLMMLMGTPILLTKRPPNAAPEAERLRFAAMLTAYAMLILLVVLGIINLAYFLVRKQREEFKDASLSNLKDLVEGTMQDHGRSPKDAP